MNLGDQPAFPQTVTDLAINQLTGEKYEAQTNYPGMSTRTWLAGQAGVEHFVLDVLQNANASQAWEYLDGPIMCPATVWEQMTSLQRFHLAVAFHKVAQADAILAELEKQPKSE